MTDDMFQRLAAPFPADLVSWRVGSVNKEKTKAMALAYIDARDVMSRFDDVCGPAGWERRHPHVDKTTTCEIAVWVEGRGWVVKADGAGDTAVEAEKGSLSDSFKRAAVNWGVGRYLYDLPSPWVEIDEWKKIKPHELVKLRGLLTKDAAKSEPASTPRQASNATPAVLPIAERAKVLCGTMRAAAQTGDRAKLQHVWDRGAALRKEMDAKEPELLFDAEVLFKELSDKLDERVAA